MQHLNNCFFDRERGPARLRRSFQQILDRGRNESERVEQLEERREDRSEREDRVEGERGIERGGIVGEGQIGYLDPLPGENIGNAEGNRSNH